MILFVFANKRAMCLWSK